MVETIKFRIDKISKGSLLEKYVKNISLIVRKKDNDEFLSFFKALFEECLEFLVQDVGVSCLPQITLKLVHTHSQFKKIEGRESKHTKSKEKSKTQARAFVIHNIIKAQVYVDLETYIHLMKKCGYPSFIFDLVQTYFHEVLHFIFPQKLEQEIYNLQCSLIEKFLGFELPDKMKNLRASDYYVKEKEGNL